MKKMVSVRCTLAALTLGLILSACGGGDTSDGTTHVTALTDSGAGSLRQAITDAKAGDTLKLTTTGTITLASPITTDKNLTILASGVTLDAAGKSRVLEVPAGVTVTVKGVTLTGGVGKGEELAAASLSSQAISKATYGGNLVNRGTLTLDGVTVSNGQANNGGGVFNEKGASLTLVNVTMTGNKATIPTPDLEGESTGSGGAIANRGTLVVESGNFKSNTAIYTGGVIRHTLGTLTIKAGTFEGNSCTNADCAGGALMLTGASTTTISGGVFTGNSTATGNSGGGAIWQAGSSTVTISGGTFTNNSSAYGGVYDIYQDGKLKITGGTFEGNTATQSGGAFFFRKSATSFEMTGGTIKGNKAGKWGGGINSDISMTLTGGSIEGNTAEGGGGINMFAQASTKNTVNLGGTLEIKGNTVKKDGGGVSAASADPDGLTINLQGAKVNENTAIEYGGGIIFGHNTIINMSGGTIDKNTAVIGGGGMAGDGTVNMTGGGISANEVTGTAKGQGGGGGVRLFAGAKMTAKGFAIMTNKARWGAGVFINGPYETSPAAEFTLAGGRVLSNVVTDSSNNGGGFFNDGKLTITSGIVMGNKATRVGGGVYNSKVATYTAAPGIVRANTPDDVFTEK